MYVCKCTGGIRTRGLLFLKRIWCPLRHAARRNFRVVRPAYVCKFNVACHCLLFSYICKQGDGMSSWQNRPKCSPTNVSTKPRKNVARNVGCICIFLNCSEQTIKQWAIICPIWSPRLQVTSKTQVNMHHGYSLSRSTWWVGFESRRHLITWVDFFEQ
jgi:hypothetical protein